VFAFVLLFVRPSRGITLKISAASVSAKPELFLFKTRVTQESGPLFGSHEAGLLRPLEGSVRELAERTVTVGQTSHSGDCSRQMR
jgi:hypothetical protein